MEPTTKPQGQNHQRDAEMALGLIDVERVLHDCLARLQNVRSEEPALLEEAFQNAKLRAVDASLGSVALACMEIVCSLCSFTAGRLGIDFIDDLRERLEGKLAYVRYPQQAEVLKVLIERLEMVSGAVRDAEQRIALSRGAISREIQ